MIERETEIVNRLGLHARAAAKLVHTAGGFQSRVTVEKDGEEREFSSDHIQFHRFVEGLKEDYSL